MLEVSNPESVTVLTEDKNWITSINWLIDGRSIIYDSDEAGDRNLWLLDTQTRQKQVLGARDAQMPSLDANNTVLAFLDVRYNANIWEVDLTEVNSEPQPLIEAIKYNNHPAYAANDELIAFATNRKGKTEIWLFDNRTGQQRPLLQIPGLNLFAPVWSLDGKHVLMSSRGKEGYRCYRVEVETGVYQPAVDFAESHSSCQLSSRNELYALTKDPERTGQIIKFNETDGQTVLLEDDISRFELSETDDIIYSHQFKDGLFVLSEDGTTHHTIIPELGRAYDEYWTVQGQYVYYPATSEPEGIWRYNLLTQKSEFVTKHLPSTIGLSIAINRAHTRMLLSRTDKREADVYLGTISDN